MTLLNADGSPAELSGNGLRGAGRDPDPRARRAGGAARSRRGDRDRRRPSSPALWQAVRGTLRPDADMGQPIGLTQQILPAAGETVRCRSSRWGTRSACSSARCPTMSGSPGWGRRSSATPSFPSGTNVEFVAHRDARSACASGSGSAVSVRPNRPAPARARRPSPPRRTAARSKRVEVVAPGGAQWVEWTDGGVQLTGWAEILCEGEFLAEW